MDPISAVVLDWLWGALLMAGQQRLVGLLGTDKQRGELVKITRAATRLAVADVVDIRDQEAITDALLRDGPDSVLPDAADAASLRDRLVAGIIGPRLTVLVEQGYDVDAERLSVVLSARIAVGIQANAARGGALLQLAEWLRHQETTGLLRETVGALLEVRQMLGPPVPAITARAAKCTLPAGKGRFFTGRATELSRVCAAAQSGGVVRIVAVDGMAGVGKTTFAVHVAHEVVSLFPDGQFFVRLHGHTPGQEPTKPGDALAALLGNLGMSAEQIPADLDERAARWRDGTAGRRILVILDDAAGTKQVEHLIPGTDGPLVLITSRHRLKALPEATTIMLRVLAPEDAADLLVRLVERDGLEPGDADVSEVVRLCGYLPLAISLTAGRFKHHASWTAADLARHLSSAANRAAALQAEDVSVAAALNVSYERLTLDQQRLFRLLALVPGPDFDAYAVAALGCLSLDTASALLEDLYDAHLADEPSPGRHRLHDLIREHAATLARADDRAEQLAALDRLLDYYAHCARLADMYLARRSHTTGPLAGTHTPAYAPGLAAPGEAAGWMRTELDNLHAAVRWDAEQDKPRVATAVAIATHGFLRTSHLWERALDIHAAALRAARKAGDRLGEAETLNNLGVIQRLTQDYPSAVDSLTAAMDIYHGLGNRLGEANTLNYLGVVQRLTGDPDGAAQSFLRALDMYRAIPDRLGEANALNYLGTLRQRTGDFAAAAASQRDALRIYEELDDRLGQADAWLGLGVARLSAGEYQDAIASLVEAFPRYQKVDSQLGQAFALKYLGAAQLGAGDDAAGTASLNRAFALYQELGSERGKADVLRYLSRHSG